MVNLLNSIVLSLNKLFKDALAKTNLSSIESFSSKGFLGITF